MLKHKLVDFIIQFMEEVDKEISEMKLFVCSFGDPFYSFFPKILISLAERESKIRGRIISNSSESRSHNRSQANVDSIVQFD